MYPMTFFIKMENFAVPKELQDQKFKLVLDYIKKQVFSLKSGQGLNIAVATNGDKNEKKEYLVISDEKPAKLRSTEIEETLNNLYFMDNINTITLNLI
jgi:hypothetical protein